MNNFLKFKTPNMAYVVGLLLADGTIEPGQRHFSVSSCDIEVLEKIRDIMQSTHPIYLRPNHIYRLRIGSKIMVHDLLRIGIIPRKSKIAKLPVFPNNLFFHLLRGFFDGDGGVYHQKDFHLKFSNCSYILLTEISEIISYLLKCDLHTVKEHNQIKREKLTTWYSLSYFGSTAIILGQAMYQNAGFLYLNRNKQSFDEHLAL